MLKVTVSSSPIEAQTDVSKDDHFEISNEKGQWRIGGKLFDGDIVPIAENHFHAIWQNKSYNIEVIENNAAEKTFHLLINGRHIYSRSKDELELLLEGMGLQNSVTNAVNNVKAPMPGLIQSVAVSEGDKVEKGDALLVLVAMKMENTIKSSGSGIVKTLKVSAGEIVEKNQVLLEFQ